MLVNKTIEDEITHFAKLTFKRIDQVLRSSLSDDPVVNELLQATLHHNYAGKGFRPAFLLLFYRACGGDMKNIDTVIDYAAAIEMLHTSSLIHDDFMDKDKIRRGKSAVWTQFSPTTAILAGDYLLGKAFELAGDKAAELGRVFGQICIGQQMDLSFEQMSFGMVSPEQSLTMLNLKTEVLFQLACRWGAVLAGADEKTILEISEYAKTMGIAFQMADDLLNIFGNPDVTGKPRASDIINEKKNPLLLVTLDRINTDNLRRFYLDNMGRDDELVLQGMIAVVRAFGRDIIRHRMSNYIQRGIFALEPCQIREDDKQLLIDFAKHVINRTK